MSPSVARLDLARELDDIGRRDEAGKIISAVLAAEPDSAEALRTLSYHRHALTDWTGALDAADRAVALEPANSWGHRLRAAALDGLNRHADALAAATEAVSLSPQSDETHRLHADTLLACRRVVEAHRAARRAIELNPKNPRGHRSLAAVLHAAGFRRAGLAANLAAVELDPTSVWSLRALAEAHADRWTVGDAVRIYLDLVRAHPTNRSVAERLQVMMDRLQMRWSGLAFVLSVVAVAMYVAPAVVPARVGVTAVLLAAWVAGYRRAHRRLGRYWRTYARRQPQVVILGSVLGATVLFGLYPGRLYPLVEGLAGVALALVWLFTFPLAAALVVTPLRDAVRRVRFRLVPWWAVR